MGITPPEPTATPISVRYAVVLVPEGGSLDAHTAPGDATPVAGTIPANYSGLVPMGNVANNGPEVWVEVQLPGGGTGWVYRKNLTEVKLPADFCADPAPLALFANLRTAIDGSDGTQMASLISPVHGTIVEYIRNGSQVLYDIGTAGYIFSSGEVISWGLGLGSGLPVQGTFSNLVRPDLTNVLDSAYETHCNVIQLGGASYTVTWPAMWKNINYYSLYKPGAAGHEMEWMTWIAGVEYVYGQPYLFSLSRYNWEP